jgi:hypothetical protein
MSSDSRHLRALSFAREWKPRMLRLPEGTRERREIAGAALLAALAMLVLGLPVGLVGRLGGVVRDVEGDAIVPGLSFAIGSACLAAATWAAVRALTYARGGWRDSPGTRLGLITLGLLGAAEIGGLCRTVLQLADLHGFYLFGGNPNPAAAYWGLTILLIAATAFALPLIVVLANLAPHYHGPCRYRRAVRRISNAHAVLLLPIVASTAIVALCAVLPAAVQIDLGYSAPSFSGQRVLFPISLLDASVWESLARLSFLPLLVGMWVGMESARACCSIAESKAFVPRIASAVDYRVILCLAAVAVGAFAWIGHAPLLVPAALALSSTVVLASAGALRRAVAIPALKTLGTRFGFSEHWGDAAPIGRILLVLAAPVLLPVCVDLWHGLEGPFRLPGDAAGYVHFWREFGLYQAASVSIEGIFGHEMQQIALYSGALIAFLLLGWLFNTVFFGDRKKGLGDVMWLLVPLALVAVAFTPILQAASRPFVAPMIAASGVPAMLLVARPPQRRQCVLMVSLAGILLGVWAFAVWNFELLPPVAVLAAAIVWRFLISPGNLDHPDGKVKFRRISLFASLALLGLGMLALSHGSQSALFPSAELADVSDRVAVAVVAPIWLVYCAARDLRPNTA